MVWQIKRKAQDFVVTEVLDDVTVASWQEKLRRIRGRGKPPGPGRYLWFTMRKTDKDFFESVSLIARGLGISTRSVSYAGTKDKRAVTSQTLSVPASHEAALRGLDIDGMQLGDFRRRDRHVRLGEHQGNGFRITVRNVAPDEVDSAKRRLLRISGEGMVNMFGEQRFGSGRHVNHIVGKRLALGDAASAVMAFLTKTCPDEPDLTRRARQALLENNDLRRARGMFPARMGPELAMISHLLRRPGDYEGALKRLPLRMLKLFVHAYQSMIWNVTAARYISGLKGRPHEQAAIPIVGYRTDLARYPAVQDMISSILADEGIGTGSFRNRRFPELSSPGSERDLLAFPRDIKHSVGKDEMNNGMMKIVLRFGLGRGSYATELVRQISPHRSAEWPGRIGFDKV